MLADYDTEEKVGLTVQLLGIFLGSALLIGTVINISNANEKVGDTKLNQLLIDIDRLDQARQLELATDLTIYYSDRLISNYEFKKLEAAVEKYKALKSTPSGGELLGQTNRRAILKLIGQANSGNQANES